MADVINIEILEDGTIKATTDPISGANHLSADAFFNFLQGLCGVRRFIKPRGGKLQVHSHSDGTIHSH